MSQQQMQQMPQMVPCADGTGHLAILAALVYRARKRDEEGQQVTYPRQRSLTDKLKPPVEPKLKSAVTARHYILGGLVFVIAEAIIAIPFAIILVKAGLIQTPLTGIGNSIVGLCALGVAYWIVRRVTKVKREELEREYLIQMRAYRSAQERYERMYYCSEQNRVFLWDRRTGRAEANTWSHEDTILHLLYKETW